jgi:hypothetical protein
VSWNVEEGVQHGACLAEPGPGADALQPPLRCGFRARLTAGVSQLSCIIVGHSVACAGMDFELVGEITQTETIASGSGVRDRARLRRHHGQGRWRKLKGIARVRLVDGTIRLAEIHWYEAHGIRKRELKLKLPFLD